MFQPRKTFQSISTAKNSWLTPMLVLSIAVLLSILASGWVQSKAAEAGVIPTPPDFQYWSQDQQAQYMQTYQQRQGPVFLYLLPALGNLTTIWLGLLILGGLLHLVITLLGGRGDTSASMNIIAWANIPLALRELVRAAYTLVSQKTITQPGLSGFVDTTPGGFSFFWSAILALIDIYLIWQIILMIVGVRTITGISRSKAVLGALIVIILVVVGQALISFGLSSLGSLSFTRPFFF